MIFELIPATTLHRTILKFKDSDAAWDAHSMICDAFQCYSIQPSIVCYGGYENALEMYTANIPAIVPPFSY